MEKHRDGNLEGLDNILANVARYSLLMARETFLIEALDSLVPKIEFPYTAEKLRKRDIMFVAHGHKMWVTTHGSRASKKFDGEPYFSIGELV